jgi:catechol 2,3-dioxygenase-like lactoylglutathione lyase family enzyme
MRQRVGLVTLGVRDLDRALTFYRALGWRESSRSVPGDVAFFDLGGSVLALWSRDLLTEDSTVVDSGGWGGVTLAHNVGSAAEVDAVLAEAEAAGAVIGRPGAPTEWGGYSGIFLDPDGHPWEVAHNPGWPIDDDGHVRIPA